MKLTRVVSTTVLASLALFAAKTGPSGLQFNCDAGLSTSAGHCTIGHVTFTGANYPNHIHVIVTRSDGSVIDDGFYRAPGGTLTFTEVLDPADAYTITTTVRGGHDIIDNFTVVTTDTTN